uniref:Uncharacterized protein n=1 Tax=Arundo donax TaxID=35708 RepID=A0A0A8Y9S4_ARUDO
MKLLELVQKCHQQKLSNPKPDFPTMLSSQVRRLASGFGEKEIKKIQKINMF